jgi:uncharacterized membrane protein (UPF0127 family)
MAAPSAKGYAYNLTRKAYLATELMLAGTHWTRLRGLMGTRAGKFPAGKGLWITPCHGVHTLGMRFAIDVVYLDSKRIVVHVEEALRPWRLAPVRLRAASVLELPPSTVSQTGTALGDEIDIGFGSFGSQAA